MYKVLIVDDEIFVRKGLINLLDWPSLQFEVCGEAENGMQALAMIREREPDLVIADIRMPLLDGLGLIRRIHEEEPHQPKFIILSGYSDFHYAQQALRYHVSDYILKPVNKQDLAATIEKIKKYIDANFRENIYLKGIAMEFGMNPVYLGQLFRKHYGVYFNEYLLSLRIEEAKRLLRTTRKRVYEIAEMVGIQNADYFAVQFEKREKMTPTEYRNRMLGQSPGDGGAP